MPERGRSATGLFSVWLYWSDPFCDIPMPMQRSWDHYLQRLLDRQPNIGRLVELCEENYRQLRRLLPCLRQMQGNHVARCPGHADLYLEILEHSRYTSLIRLTYWFEAEKGRLPEPDVLLRVYHDARQLEVIELRQSVLPTTRLYEAPGLLNKWQANWFVAKWLGFCVLLDYHFTAVDAASSRLLPAVCASLADPS